MIFQGRLIPRLEVLAAHLLTHLAALCSEKRCALCAAPIAKNALRPPVDDSADRTPRPPENPAGTPNHAHGQGNGAPQAGDLGICPACLLKLPERTSGFCLRCGEPMHPDISAGLCGNCLQNPPPWNNFYFYGVYTGYLRELLHQVKFSQGLHQAGALGKLLAGRFPDGSTGSTSQYDCIIPVPLHKRGLRRRGFNQSVLLAEPVSEKLKVPIRRDILAKSTDVGQQHGLSRSERFKNMQGAFTSARADNLRILLLDDVLTTGATLRSAVLCLLRAGAERVDAAVLARTPGS
ncbi:MAG: ComF family protein [Deltaproteobacteria bacterium]|jgi:ComF family protein|nr:ComF family protein [Deltaproteobacteria bacterium]